VPEAVRAAFKALRADTEGKRKEKRTALDLAAEEEALAKSNMQQEKWKQQNIVAGLKGAETAAADGAIANFFYANGLSFSAAQTAPGSYYREMCEAIKSAPVGWIHVARSEGAGRASLGPV